MAPIIILASASPRRRELLTYLGIAFEVAVSNAEDDTQTPPANVVLLLPPCPLSKADNPALLAWRKANAVWAEHPDAIVIGADTTVVLDDQPLNKPTDDDHARDMLSRLSGKKHTVYTGICLYTERQTLLELVASDVLFHSLSQADIDDYVATGEPLDKAGAYGIQGEGGRLIARVEGSYTNVVGLPLIETHRLLANVGITNLNHPTIAYQSWIQAQGKEPLPCPPTHP